MSHHHQGELRGIPPAEVDISPALIQQLLREQFPEHAEKDIWYLSAGWDNDMYRVGNELMVRIPRRFIAVELIENEQRYLPLLRSRIDSRINMPVPISNGQPSDIFPWPWTILKWQEGKMAFQSAPLSNQIEPLADFLQQLHQPAPPDVPQSEVRGIPLKEREASYSQQLDLLKKSSNLITPNVTKIWNEAVNTKVPKERKWMHGDLHPRNVLVHQGRINALIDWGDLNAGDVATDLSCVWMLFEQQEDRKRFFDYYTTDKATIKRALGWAIVFGAIFLEVGLGNRPEYHQVGKQTLERVHADYGIF